jgi:hypothetical protein
VLLEGDWKGALVGRVCGCEEMVALLNTNLIAVGSSLLTFVSLRSLSLFFVAEVCNEDVFVLLHQALAAQQIKASALHTFNVCLAPDRCFFLLHGHEVGGTRNASLPLLLDLAPSLFELLLTFLHALFKDFRLLVIKVLAVMQHVTVVL